jgi:AcrR family transcriptional regulator
MSRSRSKTEGNRGSTYHHGDLRNACIKAALELIEGEGVPAVTLRAVAERVGVSRSAPYRHFKDKRALLAACTAHGFRLMERKIREAADAEGGDPMAQFHAGCLAYARFGAEHPRLYPLLFSGDLSDGEYPELAAAGSDAFQVPIDLLTAAQEAGVVKRSDPRLQAFALWSTLHGVVNLHIDSRPNEVFDSSALEENIRSIIGVLWEGLAATPH